MKRRQFNVRKDKDSPGDGVATIEYRSRKIKVRIVPDDQPFQTTVILAADVVKRLPKLDKAAKRVIVACLRKTYNDGWNEYDEVQNDGSLKTVRNPKLSAKDFEERFSLEAVQVTGGEMIQFFYDDSGLFWGHSVVVSSHAGVSFSGARAELLG